MNHKAKVADVTSTMKSFYKHSLIQNERIVLILSQIICLIPVSGILTNDLHAIKFSYISVKVLLFVVVQASIACMLITYSVVFVIYDCRLRTAGKEFQHQSFQGIH